MARAIGQGIGLLMGMFSQEVAAVRKDPLEELRLALERAETHGNLEEDLLDSVRAKLAELEQQVQKELKIVVRHLVSGEVMTLVRARPSDSVGSLCEAVLQDTGEVAVAMRMVFQSNGQSRILERRETLAEAGISNGETVFIVQTPFRCLTASFDGTARIRHLLSDYWDLQVAEVEGQIRSAVLSPVGRRGEMVLLTISSEGSGILWCAETGKPLCEVREEVMSCSFSADGLRFAGASDDATARVWCVETGECLQKLSGHEDEVKMATFSPDGELVATASSDGTARLFCAETGELVRTIEGHDDVVKSAVFSPDGSLLVTASMDATARILRVADGECLQVLRDHSRSLNSASFSPNGLQVLTASFDGSARIWLAATGECLATLSMDNVVNTAVFSPDGDKVLIVSGSEKIHVFSVESGECCLTLEGHEDWVRSASYSPDGMLIASASYDNTARVWNTVTGECVQVLDGHSGAVVVAEIIAG